MLGLSEIKDSPAMEKFTFRRMSLNLDWVRRLRGGSGMMRNLRDQRRLASFHPELNFQVLISRTLSLLSNPRISPLSVEKREENEGNL
jgi:hypothetical protein